MRGMILGSALGLTLAACAASDARPVPIDIGTPCSFCRMTIADVRLAAEIVAPGEEPRFYDDIGCLAGDLRQRAPSSAARSFVVDYRTGAMVGAAGAVYTRVEAISTPMASHLVAHADDASRAADPRAGGGTPQTAAEVLQGEFHGR